MFKKVLCPKCNSSSVDYDAIDVSEEQVYYPATCKKCGCIWNEYYNLVFDDIDILGKDSYLNKGI